MAVGVGGCAGCYYQLSFDDHVAVGDRLYSCEEISIIVDAHSLEYLNGMTIDYSEDLMGGGFHFQNPHAIATCSCGQSFASK